MARPTEGPLAPVALAAASPRSALSLSPCGGSLAVADDEVEGIRLRHINTTTGAEVTRLLPRPRDRRAFRQLLAAGAATGGERVVFVTDEGAVLSWTPASGDITTLPLDLRDSGCGLTLHGHSRSWRWTQVALTPDLTAAAYWVHEGSDRSNLWIRDIHSGAPRVHLTLERHGVGSSFVAFHPHRPLMALLGVNRRMMVLNHQTGERMVEAGPQAHGASFGEGDTLLYDDNYGHTAMFDYVTGEQRRLGRGSGARGSQSRRYVTAVRSLLTLCDTADPEDRQEVRAAEITDCGLSSDGSVLFLKSDQHVTVWKIVAPLSG